MNDPELIWNNLCNNFCSFKLKCEKTTFCKNEFNVTGLCNRTSCPLSNLLYATIIEHEGECFLYTKTAERAHTPRHLWERVKLSSNFLTAINQINENMKNVFPEHQILKCKHRLTRIRQTLIRARKISLTPKQRLVPIRKKVERREASRESKALNVAKIENQIENELLLRLKEGTYGGIYKHTSTENAIEDLENCQVSVEDGYEIERDFEYIEDVESEIEDEVSTTYRQGFLSKKKINIEYEIDDEIVQKE